jgi:hypothetical protein
MIEAHEILVELKDFRKDVNSHILETRDRLIILEERTKVVENIPNRLQALEQFRWKILGGVTVISGACAYIFRHIGL